MFTPDNYNVTKLTKVHCRTLLAWVMICGMTKEWRR